MAILEQAKAPSPVGGGQQESPLHDAPPSKGMADFEGWGGDVAATRNPLPRSKGMADFEGWGEVARKATGKQRDEADEHAAHAGSEVEVGQGRPADIAARGFSGTAQPLPFKNELEQSFKQDFSHVKIHTDERAQAACRALGAHAYAMGDSIAFESPNPDKKLVAHELTHVMQQTGKGPAKKSAGVDDGEIETEGEGEAEQVEEAVAAGKPAHTALQGEHAGHDAAHAAGESHGPARKAKGPALDSKFTMGMAFSPTSMEKSYEYTLWDKGPPPIPIAAVPGLFFTIEPSVVVKAAGGVDWKEKNLKTNLGVEGGLLIGFTYGNKELAALYGGIEGTVTGGFEYSKSADSWKLEGGIKLSSNFTIGCKVAGGILDYKFDFGKVDPICTFGGLTWEKGKPFNSGWFSWGSQVQQFFGMVNSTVARAKQLLSAGVEAYNTAKQTARQAYRTGAEFAHWVSSW